MKKVSIALLLTCLIIVAYIYFNQNDDTSIISSVPADTIDRQSTSQNNSSKDEVKNFATKKIAQLAAIEKQCRNKSFNHGNKVDHIHQLLIGAFEKELKRGVSSRELLAYSSQYETFYRSYTELLVQAQINIEKQKYSITSSSSILKDFQGISIIDGFSDEAISTIIDELKALKDTPISFGIKLNLDTKDIKSKIYNLLDNGDNFTTYYESPMRLTASSVLSPSILFVLSAEKLTIDEFSSAISGRSFTVNDVAAAIRNHMPMEYLNALITNTDALGDMPIFNQNRYEPYYSLADLAVSEYNVELLTTLKAKGVKPTNEPGIITAMDLAIMNLPYNTVDGNNSQKFPKKYLQTIQYLHEQGYKAHGRVTNQTNIGTPAIIFQAPYTRSFDSLRTEEGELQTFLHQLELISHSSNILQNQEDDSAVSIALKKVRMQREKLSNDSEACKSIEDDLLAAEKFTGRKKAFKSVRKLLNNKDISYMLHEIDPVLVHVWQDMMRSSHPNYSDPATRDTDNTFIRYLREGLYQDALNYSTSVPLSQDETDTLFSLMLSNPTDYTAIWNGRTSSKQPSSLLRFKYLPLEGWQTLLDEDFDFSLTDIWGNDVFIPAIINSQEAVNFLLSYGFTTDVEKPGVDIFDLALEDSYERGKLNKSIPQILNLIEQVEPSHYARIVRLRHFFPQEYNKLIKRNERLIPLESVTMNEYNFNYFYM